MKKSTILSAAGVIALVGLFLYWWHVSPAVSAVERGAALASAALFGIVCLRFVPGWMDFWDDGTDAAPVGGEPEHVMAKIFAVFLALDLAVVLVVLLLRALWGYSDGLEFWTCTDSRHYLEIARDWYLSQGEWDRLVQLVFLPGYPLVVRAVGLLIPNLLVAGMLVSALCFAGAGCVFYRLLRLDVCHGDAVRALKFLCLLPGVFFFAAPMSESLFFLLCVSCLYCARRDKWLLAGVLGGLAAFTRSLGLMLVVPLFFQWMHVRKRTSLRPLAAVLLVPVGFGVYCFINFLVAGDPFQFMEYQSLHWNQHLGLFWNTAAYQTEWAIRSFGNSPKEFWGLWLPNLVYGFGTLLLMLFAVKRLRADYSAWFLAYYFIAMGATWLLSAPRYLIAMPTVSIALSAITKDIRTDAAMTLVCACLSVFYLCAFALRWQVW